jgi:hypothetical protein
MTETPDFAERVDWHGNANVLDESEEEALDYYIAASGREVRREYQGVERRSIGSQLDRQMSIQLGFKHSHNGPEVANRLTKHFEDYAPMSFQEGMILMEGVETRFEKILRMPTDKMEGAIKGQYNTLVKYLSDAAQDKHVLDQALVEKETGPPEPNIDLVRTSPLIHEAITKQLMARGFLWEKYDKTWPNSRTNIYKEKHKYWLGFTLAASKFANEESVKKLYEFASGRANLRFKNLFEQMSYLEEQPTIKNMKNEGKVPPINFSQLWQHKVEKPEIPREVREKTAITTGHIAVKGSLAELLPEPVKRELHNRISDREQHGIDILIDQGIPPDLARRRVLGPRAEISTEESDRQDSLEIVKKNTPPQPKRPNGGYKRGWPETGPSSKRVESD